jgi:hypothetical protein
MANVKSVLRTQNKISFCVLKINLHSRPALSSFTSIYSIVGYLFSAFNIIAPSASG